MTARRNATLGLAAWAALGLCAPAFAATAPADDEKLPAQLPSVTIRGEDRSAAGNGDAGKLVPVAPDAAQRLRLPEPPQRRATREGNRTLMVSVTPSTLEKPPALPEPRMPYTSLEGGWGPVAQYNVSLYDARFWGPALGTTELSGRAGWGWSGWAGREGVEWAGVGRLDLLGEGFNWQTGPLAGGAGLLAAAAEAGESEALSAGVRFERGLLDTGATGALPATPFSSLALVSGRARLATLADHQLSAEGAVQHRAWGTLSGPEALVTLKDFYSLSDLWQFEAGLSAGQWGFEPVLNPLLAAHYRPAPGTHAYARAWAESVLPDFRAWYMAQPAREAAPALQAERIDARGELGLSHRLSDRLWASASAGLARSRRLMYLTDADGNGLWAPANAALDQLTPSATLRAQMQWHDALTQTLTLSARTVQPLGFAEQRLGTALEGALLDRRLGLSLGLEAVATTLGAAQAPVATAGRALFARAEARYALSPEWSLALLASDVPLALAQPAPNFYVPLPSLTANVQYQF